MRKAAVTVLPKIAIALIIAIAGAPFGGALAQNILEEWATVKAPPPPTDKIKAVTLDPKKTALLSLDFNGRTCTPEQRVRCHAILPRAEKLLKEARANGVFVMHALSGSMQPSDIAQIVAPIEGEPVMRGRGDKFSGNDLEKILKDKGIDTVIVMGTSANSAVLYTAFGAVQRGFKPVVPIDTMPAETAYQEQFTIWQIANGSQLSGTAILTRSDMVKFQ